MAYVIFSIDFENNPQRMNVFMNFLAAIPRGEMLGNVLPMTGKYNGEVEHSFICNAQDFDMHLRDSAFLAGQESILHVASGNKMETDIEYLADGHREFIGCMQQVSQEEAERAGAFTYRPDLGIYWVAKKGNPDRVPAPQGWEVAETSVPEAIAAE